MLGLFKLKLTDFCIVFLLVLTLKYIPTINIALLPELILATMLSYLLVALAIELGNGRSKKVLALETLKALRYGISYVIILYVYNLLQASPETLFNGYMHVNSYVLSLKIVVAATGRSILSNSEEYIQESSHDLLEYPLIFVLALLFMLFLVGAGHLISAFISLVGFSLNLYILILFDAPHAMAREAGVKYFYLSAFSSGLMLYGVFLLFFTLGTGHFHEMNQVISTNAEALNLGGTTLHYGLLFFLVGVFFKLSAFPGHLWAAEVYEGSPDPITAFFMLPVKVAVLAFVMQLLAVGLGAAVALWQPLIALSAVGSLVWGCLGAFVEKKTKRFLAYASINQIGFLLLGVATGSFEGYRATLFYLLIYAVMNIGFLIAFLNARRPDGNSMLYLTDFRGLGQQH